MVLPLLKEAILEKSKSKTWKEAKREWRLDRIYERDTNEPFASCACGHRIKEVCTIKNLKNGAELVVGNCCVKQFGYHDTDKVHKAIAKGKLNKSTIELAFEKEIINEWEHTFILDTFRKRKLSEKQLNIRNRIETKIFREITK